VSTVSDMSSNMPILSSTALFQNSSIQNINLSDGPVETNIKKMPYSQFMKNNYKNSDQLPNTIINTFNSHIPLNTTHLINEFSPGNFTILCLELK